MPFEHHPFSDILTPFVNDGGVHLLNPSLTALDFLLLDNIDAYLAPFHSENDKHDIISDSNNDHNEHQEAFATSIDFDDIAAVAEESDDLCSSISLEDLEIEKWISHSSFPSPPVEISTSPSDMDDASLTLPWADQLDVDMVIPPSPPLSSASGSPRPTTKRPKLCTVERRLRKKEQNKTAAEKYREKKKSERQTLLDRHAHMKTRNKDLKVELEKLLFQVQQFKELFTNIVQKPAPRTFVL